MTRRSMLASMLLGTLALSPACVLTVRSAVVVDTAPPDAHHEDVPAPRSGYVWVRGHWQHQGGRWVWRKGSWSRHRGGDFVWVDGHWDRRGKRYHWVDGHWKRRGGGNGDVEKRDHRGKDVEKRDHRK